jgi:nucleoside-diphosphate-sugar epimerase
MTDTAAPQIRKVLITGSSGRIGSYFATQNKDKYDFRLVDRVPWDEAKLGAAPGEASVENLTDIDVCRKLARGMDAVIHLAADPDPAASFESLLPNNFVTTYNMFQAAHEAGVKRLVFASSIHAIDAYPEDILVFPDMAPWPRNMYGVSKIYGEVVGKYFALTLGLPTVCLRIGPYIPYGSRINLSVRDQKAYTDPNDLNHLINQCLASTIPYAIVHATSNNRRMRMDITATMRDFDYRPQADGFEVYQTKE